MKIINKLPKEISEFKKIEIECSDYDSEKGNCKNLDIPDSKTHEQIIEWISNNVKEGSAVLELASGAFPRLALKLNKKYDISLSDIS
jgi:hypothetical protein